MHGRLDIQPPAKVETRWKAARITGLNEEDTLGRKDPVHLPQGALRVEKVLEYLDCRYDIEGRFLEPRILNSTPEDPQIVQVIPEAWRDIDTIHVEVRTSGPQEIPAPAAKVEEATRLDKFHNAAHMVSRFPLEINRLVPNFTPEGFNNLLVVLIEPNELLFRGSGTYEEA